MRSPCEKPRRVDSVDIDELRRAVAALPAQVAAMAEELRRGVEAWPAQNGRLARECRARGDFKTARRIAPRAPRRIVLVKRKPRHLSLIDPLRPKPAHQALVAAVLDALRRFPPVAQADLWVLDYKRRRDRDHGPSSPPTLVDCLRAPGAPQLAAA